MTSYRNTEIPLQRYYIRLANGTCPAGNWSRASLADALAMRAEAQRIWPGGIAQLIDADTGRSIA